MKKLFVPFTFLFCVVGLKAQNTINTANQRTQAGQFKWTKTAQDSVDITRLPFMRESFYILDPDNKGNYITRGVQYAAFPDNGNNSAESKKK